MHAIEDGWGGMDIDRGKYSRYLGYGRHEADERVMDLVEQCIGELSQEARPLHLCRDYPPGLEKRRSWWMQGLPRSRNLKKPGGLRQDQPVIPAATLGTGRTI